MNLNGLSSTQKSTLARCPSSSILFSLDGGLWKQLAKSQWWVIANRAFVFSCPLQQNNNDKVTIVGKNWKEVVRSLREKEGKDIWLFGGESLFRGLAEEGFVDTGEVEGIPFVLGGGIPFLVEPAKRIELTLMEHKIY